MSAPATLSTSADAAASQAPTCVYVVGDVHFDGGSNPFLSFLDSLAQRPPARLVILGDLFEYWLETGAMVHMHDAVLSRLRRLHAAGWHLDLVLGNREFGAGRLLRCVSKCRLHWPRLDLHINGHSIRIVHGDRLCHDPGYRVFAAVMRSFWWRGWYPSFPSLVQDMVARFLRARSKAKQQRRRERPTGASRVFIDRRKVQATARGADTVIAGHIHQSWRRTIGGVDLLLVGDWPPGRGHWVEIATDGTIRRHAQTFEN